MSRSLAALLCLICVACNPSPETLTFHPEDGEHRRQQVFSNARVSAETPYGNRSEHIETHMLIDYRVHARGENYDIAMKPRYMSVDFGGGGFSSAQKPEFGDEEMRDVMEAGFTVTLDARTGETLDFVSNQPGEDLPDDDLDPVSRLFQDEYTRPGFAEGIELKTGASLTIEGNGDELPEMTLTVVELAEQEVTLSISAEAEHNRLYGYLILERDSGWLIRGAIIWDVTNQGPHNADGRIVTAIMPADWSYGLQHWGTGDMDWVNLPGAEAQPDLSEMKPATEEEVFPGNTGHLENNNDKLTLKFSMDVKQVDLAGTLRFRDPQAYGVNDKPIDLELHSLRGYHYRQHQPDQVFGNTELFALGWRDAEEKLANLGHIDVTVDWYPTQLEIMQMPVKPGETTRLTRDGAEAVLSPTDDPKIYELLLSEGQRTRFGIHVSPTQEGKMRFQHDTEAPGWVDIEERRLLTMAQFEYNPMILTLVFDDPLPEHIEFIAFSTAAQPKSSKRMRFYDDETFLDNPAIAPLETQHLYASGEDHYSVRTDALAFEASPADELQPQDFDRPQLYLTLTPEQAALCELTLVNDPEAQGTPVIWKEVEKPNGRMLSPFQLPQKIVTQLHTEDGQLQYFYDLEVVTQLRCPESHHWETLSLKAEQHDWLVSLPELLGENWETQAEQWRMDDFLREYRFVDRNERALAVLPPNSGTRNLRYSESSLLDFINDSHQLRIAGNIERIQQLMSDGDPLERQWRHDFEPLPGYPQQGGER